MYPDHCRWLRRYRQLLSSDYAIDLPVTSSLSTRGLYFSIIRGTYYDTRVWENGTSNSMNLPDFELLSTIIRHRYDRGITPRRRRIKRVLARVRRDAFECSYFQRTRHRVPFSRLCARTIFAKFRPTRHSNFMNTFWFTSRAGF